MKSFTICEFRDFCDNLNHKSFIFTNREVLGGFGEPVSTCTNQNPDILLHFNSIAFVVSPFNPSIRLYDSSNPDYGAILCCVTSISYNGTCSLGDIYNVIGYINDSNRCGIIGTIFVN